MRTPRGCAARQTAESQEDADGGSDQMQSNENLGADAR
jgi:hypothetical protein